MGNSLRAFWKAHPALLVGIYLFLGCGLSLKFDPSYFVFLLALWTPFIIAERSKILIGAVAIAAAFCYAHFLYPTQTIGAKKCAGTAYFSVSAAAPYSSPFHHAIVYKGTIESFESVDGAHFHRLPCRIYLPEEASRPRADSDYILQGTLIEKGPHRYHFKPAKEIPWQPVAGSYSLAEWRYQMKEAIRRHLKKHLDNPRSYAFLSALFTGDVDERTMAAEFSHVGLQHILAISGFHFALLAGFFSLLLRLVFSWRTTAGILLCLLSLYFLFVGSAPSVQRGWIAIFVYFAGRFFGLSSPGLNALGVGAIIAILGDPLVVLDIGFQLSYLCTLAILLFYPLANRSLSSLLPKREIRTISMMSPWQQHGYLCSALIREAFAINLAVHLFTLPVLFYLFHTFPLLSLLYNLFFPFWANIVFLLLLVSMLFSLLIPPLGSLLHACNSALTSSLLSLTSHPPTTLDITLTTPHFPLPLLITALTFLLFSSIHLKSKMSINH